MELTTHEIGRLIKATQKSRGLTQRDLARMSGTGLRFIIELEQGKPTCQFGKVLTVIDALGITLTPTLPVAATPKDHREVKKSAPRTKVERFVGLTPFEPQWD